MHQEHFGSGGYGVWNVARITFAIHDWEKQGEKWKISLRLVKKFWSWLWHRPYPPMQWGAFCFWIAFARIWLDWWVGFDGVRGPNPLAKLEYMCLTKPNPWWERVPWPMLAKQCWALLKNPSSFTFFMES